MIKIKEMVFGFVVGMSVAYLYMSSIQAKISQLECIMKKASIKECR